MCTDKEALEVIRKSNDKQLKFLKTNIDVEYTVPRKVMNDNTLAIDWLLKYIDCISRPPEID